jgi:plasmid stabilization system protein ParE
MLANNPGLGHRRPDLTDEQVYFWTVRKSYLVIYVPGTKPLEIVRILHGARDVSSELR